MKTEALELKGLAVQGIEGAKIGDVTDFYFDAPTSEAEWLVVTTGVIDKKAVLVPIADLQRDEDTLTTPYPKDQVMDAPVVDAPAIDADTEAALYEHYHLRRELPGRTENRAAWEQDDARGGEFRLRSWKAWSATT